MIIILYIINNQCVYLQLFQDKDKLNIPILKCSFYNYDTDVYKGVIPPLQQIFERFESFVMQFFYLQIAYRFRLHI